MLLSLGSQRVLPDKVFEIKNGEIINIYGKDDIFKKLKKIAVKNSYLNGMPFNHQSLICKKINGMKMH